MRSSIVGSNAGDEIGDLSRSFSTIVRRLGEYNAYMETMSGRLAHEIRTPLAVMRSSLDNLRLQPLPQDAQLYMDRAQEGLARLARIVRSMTEATRLEQMLRTSQRERFDLSAVVTGCAQGYRLAYPGVRFELETPTEEIAVEGDADFAAQMLDKLIANAADFAQPDTPVIVQLRAGHGFATLSVTNDGPLLPQDMQALLFDSMVSVRPGRADGDPHLGMGLYIARLIAQSLGGSITALNRAQGNGVELSVQVPLAANK
ncbi:MAG: ATP-binding protein [Betaproteobacteria bacterium]